LNKRTFIERPKARLWEREESPIKAGVRYSIIAERLGNKLSFMVNDQLIFDIEDPEPLTGEERNLVGIYGWDVETYFSRIKIFRGGLPIKADILEMAHHQLEKGKFELAIELFEEILQSTQDPIRQEQARQGLEAAKKRHELHADLPKHLEQLKKHTPNPELSLTEVGLRLKIARKNLDTLDLIKGIPLTSLDCRYNNIRSLEPLRDLNSLLHLQIDANQVTDLSPLKNSRLGTLNISYNPLSNLEPLHGTNLDSLHAGRCSIKSLEPLRDSHLIWLNVSGNQITDLSPINIPSLIDLNIAFNPLKNLEGLRASSISSLSMQYVKVDSLLPLEGLPLSELSCPGTNITSLNPFVEKPPRIFFFDTETLPTSELERAAEIWKSHGEQSHALHAEALLYLRTKDYQKLRKLASPFNKHSYLFIPRFTTWPEADRLAKEMGGNLLSIETSQEKEFVSRVRPDRSFWTGLIYENGIKKWSSGESFENSSPIRTDETNEIHPIHDKKVSDDSRGVFHGAYVRFSPSYKTKNLPFMVKWKN
jgi:Leucine-rich repeat (LRR) protein